MDFERYTERARAPSRAPRRARLPAAIRKSCPNTCVKAMFADRDRLALNLIRAAGGDPDLAQQNIDKLLASHAEVPRAARSPVSARISRGCSRWPRKTRPRPGDDYVTVERLLLSATKAQGQGGTTR